MLIFNPNIWSIFPILISIMIINSNPNHRYNQAAIDEFYKAMAADIMKEKTRLGGNWVVAFAIPDRQDRDVLREVLDEEAIFVVLDLEESLLREHLAEKYKDRPDVEEIQTILIKTSKMYKQAQIDEKNVIDYKMMIGTCAEEDAGSILELLGTPVDDPDQWPCGVGDTVGDAATAPHLQIRVVPLAIVMIMLHMQN